MRYQVYPDQEPNFLGIVAMGYGEDPTITRFGPGYRNHYIVHYVLEGEGFYNGHEVRKGQGFLIYPHQKEVYYPSEGTPWKFLWIIATQAPMRELFAKYNAAKETQVFSFPPTAAVQQTVKFILDNNCKVLDALKLTEVFLHLLNSHAGALPPKPQTSPQLYLSFCIHHIESNLSRKMTVGELTALLGVSQPYLYRIFQEQFHMSIKQYILQSKLNYAQKLLSETDMTITEAANSVGYDDALAFSKLFKQYAGLSPAQYRKRHAATE